MAVTEPTPKCERMGCRADATTTREIRVGDQRVLEALCDPHADAFDKDVGFFYSVINRQEREETA